MPIGNLTSQIVANIYLNELDRFVKHVIKPRAYLRYGDDFIVVADQLDWLEEQRRIITGFLEEEIKLKINRKNDIIVKTGRGLHFLGVEIFPAGRRLKKRNWQRANNRLNLKNYSSYYGLIGQHCDIKKRKHFEWKILELMDNGGHLWM